MWPPLTPARAPASAPALLQRGGTWMHTTAVRRSTGRRCRCVHAASGAEPAVYAKPVPAQLASAGWQRPCRRHIIPPRAAAAQEFIASLEPAEPLPALPAAAPQEGAEGGAAEQPQQQGELRQRRQVELAAAGESE